MQWEHVSACDSLRLSGTHDMMDRVVACRHEFPDELEVFCRRSGAYRAE